MVGFLASLSKFLSISAKRPTNAATMPLSQPTQREPSREPRLGTSTKNRGHDQPTPELDPGRPACSVLQRIARPDSLDECRIFRDELERPVAAESVKVSLRERAWVGRSFVARDHRVGIPTSSPQSKAVNSRGVGIVEPGDRA